MAQDHSLKSKVQKILGSGRMLYVFVLLILLSETTALSFLKEYSLSGSPKSLGLGLGFYLLVSIFLIRSFRYEGMGIVNVLWSAFSVILVVATGMFLFGEKIGTMEITGMMMVIAGVVVLRWSETKKESRGGQCLHISTSDIPPIS